MSIICRLCNYLDYFIAMKQTILFLFALLLFGSCINTDTDLHVDESENLVIDERFLMEDSYEVPLQSGMVTVVTLGADTIAITDIPLTISIPKNATSTRSSSDYTPSEALKVFHVNYADLPDFEPGSYISDGTYLLFFEDSFKADYDYNDLVVMMKFTLSGNENTGRKLQANVRGLALGSTKTIGFGFTDLNGMSYILTDNVRRDYFSNKQGFINTVQGNAFVQGIEASDRDDERVGNMVIKHRPVNNKAMSGGGYVSHDAITTTNSSNTSTGSIWKNYTFFITVDNGKKLYIASLLENFEEKCPYGLSIRTDGGDVIFPAEKNYIGDAFPNFETWINDTNVTDWRTNPDMTKCYKVSSADLWRW